MRGRLAGFVAAAVVLAGCTAGPEAAAGDGTGGSLAPAPGVSHAELAPSPPFDRAVVRLLPPEGFEAGAMAVPVHVAADPQTRGLGLMGRRQVPAGTGMVFLFPDTHRTGFYMKDTRIPLSIAFFDADGVILEVLDMEPCEAAPCPTYRPAQSYRSALEVPRGWFEEVGVGPGWRVELPAGLPTPA